MNKRMLTIWIGTIIGDLMTIPFKVLPIEELIRTIFDGGFLLGLLAFTLWMWPVEAP